VPKALYREAEVPWDAVEVSMRPGRLPFYVLLEPTAEEPEVA
jgi:hypothetical protein